MQLKVRSNTSGLQALHPYCSGRTFEPCAQIILTEGIHAIEIFHTAKLRGISDKEEPAVACSVQAIERRQSTTLLASGVILPPTARRSRS